jgi:chemotaxis signal transduction protein
MNGVDAEFARKLAEVREGFDQAFAAPPSRAQDALIGLLAIRVAGSSCAIRVEELVDVQAKCKVVPLPGGHPDMLGIAGMRGRLVPVYGLASLLGLGTNATFAWLAICKSKLSLGLTFDELEGYLQASPTDLYPIENERSRGHVSEVLRQAGATRSVVSTSSIIAMLRGAVNTSKQGA